LTSNNTAFFAYASSPANIGETIENACQIANRFDCDTEFKTWRQNDIVGLDMIEPIRKAIQDSTFVVADISSLNYNVIYEIGYAIGLGKRVILVRSKSSDVSHEELNRVGIFDTIGYESYSTNMELAQIISNEISLKTIATDFEKNYVLPIYVVSCAKINDVSQRITSRLSKANLKCRAFNPTEDIRLSANSAIENVSTSIGVVLDFRAGVDSVSHRHNVRSAFCGGLAHGLEIETIIFAPATLSVPLDFRNSTILVARIEDVDDGIAYLVPKANEAFQRVRKAPAQKVSRLSDIVLGDPAAENEFGDLNRYFLKSATFVAATKGNVRTIVGRKGSGKTALWARIGSYLNGIGRIVIVDLKPEGYQLVRLREEVLEHLSYGQKLHLATAFWEYLLMLEIAAKIIDNDKTMHTRNPRLTENYQVLAELISEHTELGDSDFSERLHKLSVGLAGDLSADRDFMQGKFTGQSLTNKIYSIDIKKLRRALFSYLKEKDGTWILFDNLDRGWPVHGLEDVDFVILRALIDAARKLERSFSKAEIDLHTIVFIRDDIYNELVAKTSDFGKEQPQRIDWKDPDQLREFLRLRLADNDELQDGDFLDIWVQVFCSHYRGEETSQFLIDRSMMRPRNLLNLINHCRSVAINMRHQTIEEADIEKGLQAFSTDLLVELSRELEDVLPRYDTLLWDFVRASQRLGKDGIYEVLNRAGVESHENERVLERLIYYGFIGIVLEEDDKYIYNFNYEMKLILANIRKLGADVVFCIHPAFMDTLSLE